MAKSKRAHFRIIAVVIWIITTLALAGWWFIFALRLVSQSQELNDLSNTHLYRQHRMLVTEGAFLFVLLLFGGLALLYYIKRENKRAQQIQIFFSSFTHDLKTSIASLRLQAESLEEDLKGAEQAKLLKRLVKDTVRLQLQLENSLYVANAESAALHIENINLKKVFDSLALQWPDVKINSDLQATVKADPRALESVFKNLIQNAVVHGQASEIQVKEVERAGRMIIQVSDNGRGFIGDQVNVGEPFHKHHGSGGSGVGLYLVKMLVARMSGHTHFHFAPKYLVEVILPKAGQG